MVSFSFSSWRILNKIVSFFFLPHCSISLFLSLLLLTFPSHSIISSYTVHFLAFFLSLCLRLVLPLLHFPLSNCFPDLLFLFLFHPPLFPFFYPPVRLHQELEERLRHHHHAELQSLREAHRQSIETLKQQSEQELQTLRFELEDEGKAMLGKVCVFGCSVFVCGCIHKNRLTHP